MDYFDRTMLHGNVETLVLAMLDEEDNYAYRLRWDLRDRSKGRFQLNEGHLRTHLRSLAKRGLVKSRLHGAAHSRQQRYYAITGKGRKTLDDRIHGWRRFATTMNMVLRGI